jgi:hypothetical protein
MYRESREQQIADWLPPKTNTDENARLCWKKKKKKHRSGTNEIRSMTMMPL